MSAAYIVEELVMSITGPIVDHGIHGFMSQNVG